MISAGMPENILPRIPGQLPEPHLRILRATVNQSLPAQIAQNDTEFSYDALAELIGAGYMEAKRHAQLVNPCFYNIKITFAGRQILAKLQQTKPDHAAKPTASVAGKPEGYLRKIAIGVTIALLSAAALWAIAHWWGVLAG